MAGGFIPEPSGSAGSRDLPIDPRCHPQTTATTTTRTRSLRKLTTKQEARLRSWLDEEFLKLDRGFARRTDPDSPIPALFVLLERIRPLLTVILSIPPIDPTTYLRTSTMLTLTSTVREMIAGYPLAPTSNAHSHITPPTSSDSTSARQTIDDLLVLFEDLDSGWILVLHGEVYDPTAPGGRRSREGSWREGTIQPGFGSSATGSWGAGNAGGSRQVILGREMSMTDKIRLRSSILSLRSKLLDWIEPQLHLLEPSLSHTNHRETASIETDDEVESASEAEAEMEEVLPEGYTTGGCIKLEQQGLNEDMVEQDVPGENDLDGGSSPMSMHGAGFKPGLPGEIQARIVGSMNGTLALLAI